MAAVHPSSVVEDGAEIADGVEIGPFCHVGPEVRLGAESRLLSHVSLQGRTRIGARTVVHPNAVLGGEPQYLGYDGGITELEIGEGCVIREGVTVSTGIPKFGGVTRIGRECMLMANCHVAHDCQIGDNVILVNACELGGHVKIDDHAIVSSNVLLHQFTRVGRYAFLGGGTPVKEDVIPFGMANGNPGRLHGLNVIGMRRSGLTAEVVRRTRRAYSMLFSGDTTLQDGLMQVEAEFADVPTVMDIVEFIRERGDRPICAPDRTTRNGD